VVEIVHTAGVPAADRRHLENLPGEQLDAIVFAEDATLGHLVKLANGEEMLPDFNGHDELTCRQPGDTQVTMPARDPPSLRTALKSSARTDIHDQPRLRGGRCNIRPWHPPPFPCRLGSTCRLQISGS
jgi:hypothetical protein